MQLLGGLLQCDRIFFYLRHPDSRMGRTPFCWRQSEAILEIPEIYDDQWSLEDPKQLEQQDPLFAAALNGQPSIFVEDVEEADSTVLNRDYERRHFGHRALVHAHLFDNQKLWGILQPCMFAQPRTWTASDRALINYAVAQSELLAIDYVTRHHP
jgi:GAF domain-containing protein